MNSIFSRVSAHEKKAMRQLESIGKDFIRTNAAATFNQICIDNNLLPKLTKSIQMTDMLYGRRRRGFWRGAIQLRARRPQ